MVTVVFVQLSDCGVLVDVWWLVCSAIVFDRVDSLCELDVEGGAVEAGAVEWCVVCCLVSVCLGVELGGSVEILWESQVRPIV